MNFVKMEGLGNDYIYFYSDEERNWSELSVKYSDRHFGIGSDGIIVISHSNIADFKMRIFNGDGSEAKMCGNGIRCVGKYVYDHRLTDKTELTVETQAGIRQIHLELKDNSVRYVTVQMGKAVVSPKKELSFDGANLAYYPVNMGNPHAVILCKNAEQMSIEIIGKAFQNSIEYPDGVNVEFVSKSNKDTLRMRVFERGSGVTMACGTGACASLCAAVFNGLIPFNKETEVVLDGGSLFISVDNDYQVIMKGPAETVFEGEVAI